MIKEIIICLFVLMLPVSAVSNDSEVNIGDMQSFVFSYKFYVGNIKFFDKIYKNIPKVYSDLFSKFENDSHGINVRLSMTHNIVTIDSSDVGNKYSNNSSALFVSKLQGNNDGLVFILSSVSPRRVTIFLINNLLNIKLLYDSFDYKNNLGLVCHLDYAEVIDKGIIKLVEVGDGVCNLQNSITTIIFNSNTGGLEK